MWLSCPEYLRLSEPIRISLTCHFGVISPDQWDILPAQHFLKFVVLFFVFLFCFVFLCSGCKRSGPWWNGKRQHLPEEAITAPAVLRLLHCIVGFFFFGHFLILSSFDWICRVLFVIQCFAVYCFTFIFYENKHISIWFVSCPLVCST